MRVFVMSGVMLFGLLSPAAAFENFIPLGTGYSTEVSDLAGFESPQAEVIGKADIYETELYRIGRNAQETDSFFRRFQSDAEIQGGDTAIDY